MLASGALLHDRYRILRPIGRGGMGAVYEALDSRLQNTVAVKQMTIAGRDADRAFENEAKLLAALRHASLPVVIDYFVDPLGQFLVMQYIEGEDLEQLRAEASPGEVVKWALAVLDALAYLHGSHPPIVHRDIKPANLKRTPRGEIILLDFGLAKGRADSQTKPITEERSLVGFTLKYAPIEQIEGRGTDPRSDVYALGATLYHLATGVAPPSALQRSGSQRDGRPDPLRDAHTVNAGVDEAFSRVLTRALALEPANRFQSAIEMRAALTNQASMPKPVALPSRAADEPRRVDAAMPSQAEVGQLTDLIVQVRFADSPVLGLEDWPSRRVPAQIEQRSEQVKLAYPTDPATGSLLPAELQIKIVAPDFKIEGRAEQRIEVPPDEYSKRLVFLLAAQRAGYCRVNVEVYDRAALYLGTIAVESEAVGAGVAQPLLRVANLVLGVFARQVAEARQLAEAKRRESQPRLAVPVAFPAAESRRGAAAESRAAAIGSAPSMPASQPTPSRRTDVRESSAPPQPAAAPKGSRIRRALMIAPLALIAVAVGTDFIVRRQGGTPPATPSTARATEPTIPVPDSAPAAPKTAPSGSKAAAATPPPSPQPAAVAPSAATAAPPVSTAPPTTARGPRSSAPSGAALPPFNAEPASPAAPPPPAPSVPAAPPTSAAPPNSGPGAAALPSPAPSPPASSAPAPPAAATPSSSDQNAIQSVLRAYLDAYEHLDAAGVARVFPRVNAKGLESAFSGMTALDVRMEGAQIVVNGSTATISGTWTSIPRMRTGRGAPTSARTVLTLEKIGEMWLIVGRR